MKSIIALVCLATLSALCTAEPPSRFRSRTRFFARQEAIPAPEEPEATTEAAAPYPPAQSGPYPPSGWKPEGKAFELPNEKAGPPATSYGTPNTVYGPPTTPPPATDAEGVTEAEAETVPAEDEAAEASGRLRSQKLQSATVQQGDFFLLVPDVGLQRLELVTPQRQNSKFGARLQQAPIFVLRN